MMYVACMAQGICEYKVCRRGGGGETKRKRRNKMNEKKEKKRKGSSGQVLKNIELFDERTGI